MSGKQRMTREQLELLCQVFKHEGKQFEMGIDEAGRGPVFGPMVYGAAWWPVDISQKLATLGFDDSKKLTEPQRQRLFETMKTVQNKLIFFNAQILSAMQISNKMFGEGTCNQNLNEQSHNAAIRLIRDVLDKGFKLKRVYLDTVGDPGRYEKKLYQKFQDYNVEFIVSKKADSLFKVVSAASIVAKVTRDRAIKDWKFIEPIQTVGELGSGYPSDPKTKEWIKNNRDPVYGYPSLIRFSWGTTIEEMNPSYFNFPSQKIEKQKNKVKQISRLEERFGVIDSLPCPFTA